MRKIAKNEAVRSNGALVMHVARRYVGACIGAIELDDLVQAGTIGLIKALETFDPTKGALSTWAVPWIHHEISIAASTRRRAHPTTPLDQAGEIAANDNAAPDLLDRAYRLHDLAGALDTLDARERRIVDAFYFGDASREEVSAAENLGFERVRQIRKSALAKLRASLEVSR